MIGIGRSVGVMGDHHNRLTELADRPTEEAQDLGSGSGVEVSSRLVGEDDVRSAGERTSTGDPLLLPTGELVRLVSEPVAQAHRRHDRVEPLLVDLLARDIERQGDVLLRGECWHQVVGLEDEADLVAPYAGQFGVVERGQFGVADEHLARCGRVERRHAMHECRLAGPRRPHDGRVTAAGERDGHVAQRDDLGVALAIHLPQPDSARCGMVGVQRRRGWHSHWGSSVCRVTVRRYGVANGPDSRTRPVPRPRFGDDVIEQLVPREDKCPDARWVVHSPWFALVVVHRPLCLGWRGSLNLR